MSVLSIQSSVSCGYVGNSAAVPVLQGLGWETWPLHTAVLSSHVGRRGWRGRMTPVEELDALLDGLDACGALARCEVVLTGYLGAPQNADLVTRALARVRARRPGARHVCDPVIGDHGRVYVHPEVAEAFAARLAPGADVLTPNRFELELLSGRAVRSLGQAVEAVEALVARGPRLVVGKGIELASAPDQLHLVASDGARRWWVRVPRLPGAYTGAGDAFTALLTAALLAGWSSEQAVWRSAAAMTTLIEHTRARGRDEVCPVGARLTLDPRPDVVLEALDVDA